MNKKTENNVVIITGFSGAGISSVLKRFEDLGYEAFDNFPVKLVDALLEEVGNKPIAIGIDTRTRGFSAETVLETAKRLNAHLLFIVCDDEELQRRFAETRRRHPQAQDRPVHVGIKKEHELLDPVRERADLVIDTTTLSVHDLRHMLEGHFEAAPDRKMTVSLMSFGYKHGIPREADIVMNVQFLDNPHWIPDLKPLTGKDKAVGDYIEKDPDYKTFLNSFQTTIQPLIPRYAHAGKKYLTIAIGCTGGRHRSVYIVEKLAGWLKTLKTEIPVSVYIDHRDLDPD